MQNTKVVTGQQDPYATLIGLLDRAFIRFYSHVRQNSRRLTRLVVTLLPLVTLLVGSCKTSQLPEAYITGTSTEQFRAALFPDQTNAMVQKANYHPAAGYVSEAQAYVVDKPQALMKLTQQEIGFIFGKPTFRRRDASAEVWQYKTASCVADFYFYNDSSTRGQAPLSYIDVRTKADLIPGSAPRTTPVSASEKSACLHDVVGEGFSSIHV